MYRVRTGQIEAEPNQLLDQEGAQCDDEEGREGLFDRRPHLLPLLLLLPESDLHFFSALYSIST